MEKRKTIIPIASGKGGVGKTFFAANLAIALAETGHTTIAVDMDLGGSNLHSLLGLGNRFPGIGDFLKARIAELAELLVSTEIPNLQFLPGDGLSPFMANIPHAQKIRLISRLLKLPAEYILIDLGGGTSFNTLDFFRLSSHGFVVTTLEYPSIMNMLTFLKHFILRVIEGYFSKDQQIRDLLRSLYKLPFKDQKLNIETLILKIADIDPAARETIPALCRQYRPRMIFNMGDHPADLKIAEQIDASLKEMLSIEVDYFGFVFNDSRVRQSIKKRISFLPHYRNSRPAENIERIAERIVKFWDRPVGDSADRLLNYAWKEYKNRA